MKGSFLLVAVFVMAAGLAFSQTVINYGNLTLNPPFAATNYGEVWDLTLGDLVLSYTIDMSGVTQPAPWQTSYTEVGIRELGAGNFNPGPFGTYQGGKGGWLTSLVGDLTPTPNTQSLHDKHNLSASGGRDELDYDATDPNTIVGPFGTYINYGIWFDRDGVDPWQATYWGSINGGTYNTGGIYNVVITYHAVSPSLGTMFVTLNGIPTGFYTAGWQNAPPNIYPAGLSFKGDMTKMQAFAGIWAPNGGFGPVALSNITVSGILSYIHNFVFLADEWVKINQNKESDGRIHSNGKVEFGRGAPGTHTGNLSACGDITIRDRNTIIGNAIAGDDLYLFGSANVTGTATDHAAVAAIPMPSPSFSGGGPNKTVVENGALTLLPGYYGKVKVNRNGTLFMSSGNYFIDILDTEPYAKLSCDVSGGLVKVHVKTELELEKRVQVLITGTGAATDRVLFITLHGPKVDIGENAIIRGAIIAPNTEVHFSDGCKFRGSVCAESITLDPGVKFQFHTSTAPFPKPSEMENLAEEEVSGQESVASSYALELNYPNPFNPTTNIRFALPEEAEATLVIYNSMGQIVRTLVSGTLKQGWHTVNWDAKNDQGERVASGVYVYVLKTGTYMACRKLVLMK